MCANNVALSTSRYTMDSGCNAKHSNSNPRLRCPQAAALRLCSPPPRFAITVPVAFARQGWAIRFPCALLPRIRQAAFGTSWKCQRPESKNRRTPGHEGSRFHPQQFDPAPPHFSIRMDNPPFMPPVIQGIGVGPARTSPLFPCRP